MNAISGVRAPRITPPAVACSAAGPKSGASSPASSRRCELDAAAAPVERRPALGRRVQEDRQPERADPRADRGRRLRARSMSSGRSGTIGTTSAAPMHGCAPSCAPQVDPLDRDVDAGDERVAELVLGADEREHRAVVVGVGVDVEQPRVRRQRVADRVDRRLVAPFAEVGNRLERQHAPTLRVR